MNIIESILFAVDSVRVNKLRSFLTLLSISIGVFAIVGAGSLVSSIEYTVNSEKANLGENTFMIKKMPTTAIRTGNTWRKYRKRKPILYSQVKDLKRQMTLTNYISAHSESGGNTVKSDYFASDPDVSLIGTDENYFINNNTNIDDGRPFSLEDINLNRKLAIIGNDVRVKIFPNMSPIGQRIKIGTQAFTVIGVLETKGAVLGRTQDNQVIIPVTSFLKYYAHHWDESLNITIRANSQAALIPTIDESIGILRSVRNVKPWEENSFEVETNETITDQFGDLTSYLSYFGFFSGAIALIAAGVGIMNIMLVSVKERTREIGVRKAVGAKRFWILSQFIVETITLCQIGGIFGILLGITGAWLLSFAIQINLLFPFDWIVISIVICTVLGVFSGSYPAWKAANLNPIDALHYE